MLKDLLISSVCRCVPPKNKPVAAELDLSGFAVGDAVSFELRVEWEAARPVAVTAMEKLPAETELALD